jgi:hypothetical protein
LSRRRGRRARALLRVLAPRPAETEHTLANVVLGDLLGEQVQAVIERLPVPRRQALESALLLGDAPPSPVDRCRLTVKPGTSCGTSGLVVGVLVGNHSRGSGPG